MEWNEWLGLFIMAAGVATMITREIGRLVDAQRETNNHLREIKANLLQTRLDNIR